MLRFKSKTFNLLQARAFANISSDGLCNLFYDLTYGIRSSEFDNEMYSGLLTALPCLIIFGV